MMKKHKIMSILGTVSLFVLISAAILDSQINQIDTTDEDFQLIEFETVKPIFKEGTQISLEQISYNEEMIRARICMDLPSTDIWNPYATITINNQKIVNSNVLYEDYKNPDIKKQLHRCFSFNFPNTSGKIQPDVQSITIDKIWRQIGDGRLDEASIEEIKSHMASGKSGIDFTYVIESSENGGAARVKILQLPNNITEDEALQMIYDASYETIFGNWHFDIVTK